MGCELDIAPDMPFIHVVRTVEGARGPARVEAVALAHLYALVRESEDAIIERSSSPTMPPKKK
jgi:hypothetical protein